MLLTEFFHKIGFDIDDSPLRNLTKRMEEVKRQSRDVFGGLRELGSGVEHFGKRVSLYLGAPVAALATTSVVAASKIELLQLKLRTFIESQKDSKQTAEEFFGSLGELEKKVHGAFSQKEIYQYSQRLLQMGYNTEETTDKIMLLGKALLFDPEKMGSALNALEKLRLGGKIDIKTIRAMGGKELLDQLEAVTGMSGKYLKKMESLGGEVVGETQLTQALLKLVSTPEREKYTAEWLKTVAGSWDELRDSIERTRVAFGDYLIKFTPIGELINRVTSYLDELNKKLTTLKGPWAAIATGIAIVIGPLLMLIGFVMTFAAQIGTLVFGFLAWNKSANTATTVNQKLVLSLQKSASAAFSAKDQILGMAEAELEAAQAANVEGEAIDILTAKVKNAGIVQMQAMSEMNAANASARTVGAVPIARSEIGGGKKYGRGIARGAGQIALAAGTIAATNMLFDNMAKKQDDTQKTAMSFFDKVKKFAKDFGIALLMLLPFLPMDKFFKFAWGWIKKFLGFKKEAVAVAKSGPKFLSFLGKIFGPVTRLLATVGRFTGLATLFRMLRITAIFGILQKIIRFVGVLRLSFVAVAAGLAFIVLIIQDFWMFMHGNKKTVFGLLLGDVDKWKKNVADFFRSLWGFIVSLYKVWLDYMNLMITPFKLLAEGIWYFASNAAMGIWDIVTGAAKGIWDVVKPVVGFIVDTIEISFAIISNIFEGAFAGFSVLIEGFVLFLKQIGILDWVNNEIIQPIVKGVTELFNWFGSLLKALWDKIAGEGSPFHQLIVDIGAVVDKLKFLWKVMQFIPSEFGIGTAPTFLPPASSLASPTIGTNTSNKTTKTAVLNTTVNVTVPPGTPEYQVHAVRKVAKEAAEQVMQKHLRAAAFAN